MTDERQGDLPADLDDGDTDDIVIKGKRYVLHKGTAAHVELRDDDGNIVESVLVPYDEDNRPSEDDVVAEAVVYHQRRTFFSEWLDSPEGSPVLDKTTEELRDADLFATLLEQISDAIRRIGIKVSDGDPNDLELDSLRQSVEEELIEIWINEMRGMLTEPGTSDEFQRMFAKEALLQAYLDGAYAFEADGGDFDQPGAMAVYNAETFHEFYVPAVLNQTRETIQTLLSMIVETMESPDAHKAIQGAAERLRKQQKEKSGRRRRGAAVSAIAPMLQRDFLTTCSELAYAEARKAIDGRSGLKPMDGSPWPTLSFQRTTKQGAATGDIQLRHVRADQQAWLDPEQIELLGAVMWQQRDELSPLSADALDGMCHLWIMRSDSPDAAVEIAIDELIELRDQEPKKGAGGRRSGYRPAQRQAMAQAIGHVQSVWVRATIDEERRGKKTQRVVDSRLFVITDAAGQMQLDGSVVFDKIRVVPGKHFGAYLFGQVGRQTALLDTRALSLNPKTHAVEKRMIRYFSQLWRVNAQSQEYVKDIRVATLLAQIGLELNRERPGLTRERLEKALEFMVTDQRETKGPILNAWQYKAGSWDEADADHQGWADKWIRALITVEAPDRIRQHNDAKLKQPAKAKLKQPAKAKALPMQAGTLGEQLRATRHRLGLTQMQAAEEAGISQQTYSRAERGDNVWDDLRRKLDAWIKRHAPA